MKVIVMHQVGAILQCQINQINSTSYQSYFATKSTRGRQALERVPPSCTYRRTVLLLDAGHDLGRDHDGVAALHRLEHEDAEVEVVDEAVGAVAPRVERGEHAVRRVAAAVRVDEARRVPLVRHRLPVAHAVHHDVGQLRKVPT